MDMSWFLAAERRDSHRAQHETQANVTEAFGALQPLDADLPPFPVEVNTMYIQGDAPDGDA